MSETSTEGAKVRQTVFGRGAKKAGDDQRISWKLIVLMLVIVAIPILYVRAVDSAANAGARRAAELREKQEAVVNSDSLNAGAPSGGRIETDANINMDGFTSVLPGVPEQVWGDGLGCQFVPYQDFLSVCVADYGH